MSRLEEECIMYVGRNRSGIDAGEIDYGIFIEKFESMSIPDLKDALRTLIIVKEKVHERLTELELKERT